MKWQCPRCETFNRAAEAHCDVCDLAKPKRKTATKKKNSSLAAPTDLMRNNLPTKSASGGETFGFKVIDRRSSALAKSIESGKPVTTKFSEPPISSLPTADQSSATQGAAAVIDAISWLALLGFNIYSLYDFIAVQHLEIGWLILGMVWQNFFLLLFIGAVTTFLKWLLSPPPDATK